jgi:hypothetical protein
MPYGKPIAIIPCDVPADARELQKIVFERLRTRHQIERTRKQCTELRKDIAMLQNLGTAKANVDARRKYLTTEYVPALRNTGMTSKTLREMFDQGVVYAGGEIKTESGIVLFKVPKGEEAFQKIQNSGGLHRELYVRKGVLATDGKHYVKDDCGRFTRRYAFAEKDWQVFMILLNDRQLQGKAVTESLDGDPYKKGPVVKQKYDFSDTNQDSARMSAREMAFINQEDGSTIQRALPLGSSSKDLHGNEGYRFGKPDGVRLKIDLARIPREGDMTWPSSALFNLYCYDAQRDAEHGTIGLTTHDIKFKSRVATRTGKLVGTAEDSKHHTDTSTTKNRELCTLKIPLESIVEVIVHDRDKYEREGERIRSRMAADVAVSFAPHPGTLPEEFYSK